MLVAQNKSDSLIVWNLRPLKPQNHVLRHQYSKLHIAHDIFTNLPVFDRHIVM